MYLDHYKGIWDLSIWWRSEQNLQKGSSRNVDASIKMIDLFYMNDHLLFFFLPPPAYFQAKYSFWMYLIALLSLIACYSFLFFSSNLSLSAFSLCILRYSSSWYFFLNKSNYWLVCSIISLSLAISPSKFYFAVSVLLDIS